MVRINVAVCSVRLARVAIRTIKKTSLGHCYGSRQLLNNGVACPVRSLDHLSNKDGSGPAMVILAPLANTGIRHIAISTMAVTFHARESEVL